MNRNLSKSILIIVILLIMLYLVYCFVKYKRILQTAEVLSVINIENKLKKYYSEKLDFPDNINLFIKYLGTVCEN